MLLLVKCARHKRAAQIVWKKLIQLLHLGRKRFCQEEAVACTVRDVLDNKDWQILNKSGTVEKLAARVLDYSTGSGWGAG
jgi:hypothetical protein